jgi:hypothetical protein
MNAEELKTAIEKKRFEEQLAPLDEQSLDHEVSELMQHAFMVNEMGRMVLFNALKNGSIGVAEFKRRALVNNPGGQGLSRF